MQTTGTANATFEDVQDTTAATTQADLFNPDQSGAAMFGGGQEPLVCAGVRYGKTIWYDLLPKVPGGIELVASGFPSAINVYRYSLKTLRLVRSVGCQASASLGNDFPVLEELEPGIAYTVQIGGLQTASGFDSGSLDLQGTFLPDHDGDGVFDVVDACPFLPGPEGNHGNGCPPTLHSEPRYTFSFANPGVTLGQLRVDGVPGRARVAALCHRCRLRQVSLSGPHASSVTLTAFAGRTLLPGDKLEIWVTKRHTGTGAYRYGAIGNYFSYTTTSNSLGTRVTRCLMPGSLTPRRTCPPGGRRSHIPDMAGSAIGPARSGASILSIKLAKGVAR